MKFAFLADVHLSGYSQDKIVIQWKTGRLLRFALNEHNILSCDVTLK